jgi:competence protein ComEC
MSLSIITVCFCFGVILGEMLNPSFTLVYILTIALFISFLFFRKAAGTILLCVVLFLGMLVLGNSKVIPKNHISNFIYKSSDFYIVKGFIKNEPQEKENGVSFVLQIEEAQFDKQRYLSSGELLVIAKENQKLSYGDELILSGEINFPRKWFNRQNIDGVVYIKTPAQLIKLNKNKGLFIKKLSLRLKKKMQGEIYRNTSSVAAGVISAMVLGDKSGIPRVVYDSMVKSGTVHILVVSGFNVGIVAFLIILILKVLRIKRLVRYLIAIICLIIYCFITGASTPVVRATVMGVFILVALLIKREADIYNSLSLAAIFILIMNPRELFSISFQLSFVSVLAIITIYPKLKSLLRLESVNIRFLRVILEGFAVSLSAWLGTFGFILYYFKIFSPITVIANIFIVPLATLITLSGFSLIAFSTVFPVASALIAYAVEFFVILLLRINSLLINIPFAYLYL